ncbi:MAG: phospholipase D-like domain-containing protein, partial [Candidatus Dormibacterales bacterium]
MAALPPAAAAAFLTDGGQSAESVAERLAAFLGAARLSLDIAIYDLALREGPARVLETAIRAVLARGVEVRLLFNVDHALTPAVPPPPAVDEDLVRRLGIPFRPVSGVPDLMHHKYVVRDAGTPGAAVLTGSTNWTDDSWTREENVIVTIESDAVAAAYRFDFEELWTTGEVAASGHQATGWSPLPGGAEGERLRPHFTPGHAHRLVHAIARRI